MTLSYRYLIWLVLSIFCVSPLVAQQDPQAQAALVTDNTTVETGQFYEVRIDVRDVSDLWSANFFVRYDPTMLYIVGTESGSPVQLGDFFPVGLSMPGQVIFNTVLESNDVQFTPTLFNPAEPVSGSGTIGTFQIFPLQAGTTQLRFNATDMSQLRVELDDQGERVGASTEPISVLPILLDLTINGDPATPPPEATATHTPIPTGTPAPDETEAPTATLFNATAAPITPVPEAPTEVPSGAIPPILLVAIGLIAVGGVGLVILLIVARRRS